MAPYLPGSLLIRALTAAREIGDEGDMARLLAELARLLGEEGDGLLGHAIGAVVKMRYDCARSNTIVAIGPSLPRDLCLQELRSLKRYRDLTWRCNVLQHLATILGETECQSELSAAVMEAETVSDDAARAQAFLHLLPTLRGENRGRVMSLTYEAIRRASPIEVSATLQTELLDHLPATGLTLSRFWGKETAAEDDENEVYLISYDMVLASTIEAAMKVEWPRIRATVLAGLFRHLNEQQRQILYPELLRSIRLERDFDSSALAASASSLSAADRESFIPAAFDELERRVTTSQWADYNAECLADLAPHLPPALYPRLLAAFITSSRQLNRPRLLQHLPYLMSALAECEGRSALRVIGGAVCDSCSWFQ
jgi:hypothetical protein